MSSYFLKIDTPPLYKRAYPCFILFLVCFILELPITNVLTSRTYFFFVWIIDFLEFCFLIFLNFSLGVKEFILFLFLSFFGHRPRQKTPAKNIHKKHHKKNQRKKIKIFQLQKNNKNWFSIFNFKLILDFGFWFWKWTLISKIYYTTSEKCFKI